MKLFSTIFYFLFFISFSLYSQTDTLSDSNKKNVGKNVIIGIPNKKFKKPISLDIGNNDGFKKAFDNKKKKDAKKKKEEDLNNKGILSDAKISEERFLK